MNLTVPVLRKVLKEGFTSVLHNVRPAGQIRPATMSVPTLKGHFSCWTSQATWWL